MAGRAGFPGRLRWALPGSAVCALAAATPLVVLHRGSSQVSESPAVKAPLLSWPLAGVLRLISSYAIRTGKRCRSLPTAPRR